MTPRGNIYLWLVATAAIAALTSWIVTHRSAGLADGGGLTASFSGQKKKTKAGPSASGPTLHDWMHRQLDLSPAQHASLAPLELAFENERVRLRESIITLGAELAVAMRDEAPESEVFAIQRRLNAAQGALQEATLKHFIAMRRQLTAHQAREFALWTHDSLLLPPSD